MTQQIVGKQLFKNPEREFTALGINIYGGGFTLGVLKHFHVLAHWEENKLGMNTFALNFPDIPRVLSPDDHTQWPVKEMLKTGTAPDFIFANPPCVPWSFASRYSLRTGQKRKSDGEWEQKTKAHRFQDPLLALTDHTMRTAIKLRPRVFISESVENAYNIGHSHYDQYLKAWHKAGYATTYFLTDAVIHGAPCRRRRFHFVAHDRALQLPKQPVMEGYRCQTVKDAIWDLRKRPFKDDGTFQHALTSSGKWASDAYRKYLRLVPPLGRLRQSLPGGVKEFKARGHAMPSIFVYRLAWDMPAQTMMGFSNVIHPDGERFLTYREGMRLMTYPDNFRIHSHTQIDAYDAVIPLVGELLAGMAKRTIVAEESLPRGKPGHTVVDWRPLGVGRTGGRARAKMGLAG